MNSTQMIEFISVLFIILVLYALLAPSRSKLDIKRYVLRQRIFDHPSELEFYRMLRDEILGEKFVAMVQIPLICLVNVHRRHERGGQSHVNRIQSKRIDYVICVKDDLKPLLAIELDGSSHEYRRKITRDRFVDSVLKTAGLPVLHVALQRNYNKAAVALSIADKLGLEDRVIKRLEIQAGRN